MIFPSGFVTVLSRIWTETRTSVLPIELATMLAYDSIRSVFLSFLSKIIWISKLHTKVQGHLYVIKLVLPLLLHLPKPFRYF